MKINTWLTLLEIQLGTSEAINTYIPHWLLTCYHKSNSRLGSMYTIIFILIFEGVGVIYHRSYGIRVLNVCMKAYIQKNKKSRENRARLFL